MILGMYPSKLRYGLSRLFGLVRARYFCTTLILQSNGSFNITSLNDETEPLNNTSQRLLPFDRRHNHFGHIVRSDLQTHDPDAPELSAYRKEDGSFIKGQTAEEARLHDNTLKGRMNHKVIGLPEEIAKTINNNILRLATPDRLRAKAALIYQSINKEQLQSAPTSSLEADAHIAALFLQDYAHSYQVLSELKKRFETAGTTLSPNDVLTVGYGPATGMVALNELLGDQFNPETKDAYIVGRSNNEMKKRAKIILSRQMNEQVDQTEEQTDEQDVQLEENEKDHVQLQGNQMEDLLEENEVEQNLEEIEDYVGPVDTSRLHVKTKLRDTLPTNKSYDLIIVNQALLTKEHHFPRDVDTNIHMLLNLLRPEGHIVLVERGNSLGFETIARARQIMIRPESFEKEAGKIPRPYIKGSSIKPQKLRNVDQLINDDHVRYEEKLLAELEREEGELESDLEKSINEKHGNVSKDDLKFDFEGDENFEVTSEINTNDNMNTKDTGDSLSAKEKALGPQSVDYHLQVVAPCPHHSKCPLQLGDPKYYKISSHKHRLNFCSFDKVVERPRYTLELKKGKRLSAAWDKSAEDGFGLDKLKRNDLKRLSGSGRPGGNNTENGSYSYLIVKRSSDSIEAIKQIEHDREYTTSIRPDKNDPTNWPRILDMPTRIKNNVKLTTCSPTGNIEVWQIPKSLGKQEYHDARKVERGDLWGLGKKSVIQKNQLSDKVKSKLDVLSKTQKKSFLKEQRKKTWKKLISKSEEEFDNDIVKLSDSIATNLEASKNYKTKGKRAKYDVDPRDYDGR